MFKGPTKSINPNYNSTKKIAWTSDSNELHPIRRNHEKQRLVSQTEILNESQSLFSKLKVGIRRHQPERESVRFFRRLRERMLSG